MNVASGPPPTIEPTEEVGVKNDEGKNRLDLIPPEAEEALGWVMTHGAKKYGDHNWLHGLDYSRLIAAAKRHINSFQAGEEVDAESGLPVLWHALTNIAFLITYEQLGIGNDDRRHVVMGWDDGMSVKNEDAEAYNG